MAALVYYIAVPFIYLLSILPFRLLYLISDFLYFVLYYIVGYRKRIVITNLQKSFPNYSEVEINTICKKHYKYFCDLLVETLKTLTISKQSALKHCKINESSLRLFDELANKNMNFVIVLGHLGNWEWAGNSFSLLCKHQLYVIYHPLSNKYFDKLMYRMRTRFGTKLIAMNNVYKGMLSHKKELNATAFISDQTPHPDNAMWTTFLNQDTPVFRGPEVIAGKLNLPIIYIRLKLIKRGYYELNAENVSESTTNKLVGELTIMHTKKLERDIIAQPEAWLWTHRRWKYKR